MRLGLPFLRHRSKGRVNCLCLKLNHVLCERWCITNTAVCFGWNSVTHWNKQNFINAFNVCNLKHQYSNIQEYVLKIFYFFQTPLYPSSRTMFWTPLSDQSIEKHTVNASMEVIYNAIATTSNQSADSPWRHTREKTPTKSYMCDCKHEKYHKRCNNVIYDEDVNIQTGICRFTFLP